MRFKPFEDPHCYCSGDGGGGGDGGGDVGHGNPGEASGLGGQSTGGHGSSGSAGMGGAVGGNSSPGGAPAGGHHGGMSPSSLGLGPTGPVGPSPLGSGFLGIGPADTMGTMGTSRASQGLGLGLGNSNNGIGHGLGRKAANALAGQINARGMLGIARGLMGEDMAPTDVVSALSGPLGPAVTAGSMLGKLGVDMGFDVTAPGQIDGTTVGSHAVDPDMNSPSANEPGLRGHGFGASLK